MSIPHLRLYSMLALLLAPSFVSLPGSVFNLAMAQSPPSGIVANWQSETLPIKLDVGYAVRTLDLNRDDKLDIVITDSKRWLWLENPSWKIHIMHETPEAKADNVCFAEHDIDGDGRIDFAVGHDWQPNNTESGGKIGWLRSPQDPKDRWDYFPIAELPTTHRMAWADLEGEGKWDLIVVPLKGPGSVAPTFDQTPVPITQFQIPSHPESDPWPSQILLQELHVAHNFQVIPSTDTARQQLLVACYEGVIQIYQANNGKMLDAKIGAGNTGIAPAKGASEVKMGITADGSFMFATIEPWHGNEVVVYGVESDHTTRLYPRVVIDNQLKWGHAVWLANLDEDDEDELVVGVRDDVDEHRSGVRVYDFQDHTWSRQLIAPGEVAVEDLVVADLDGDGRRDIVAVGRATHNAVIYWNRP